MTNILVTGGDSRFANILKKTKSKYNFIFRSKSQLNINSQKSIKNNIKKFKPKMVLHLAGLSRPMDQHHKNINKSIQLNIMGTCNLVMVCNDFNVKLIYFSTTTYILVQKEITMKKIHYYHGIIMDGQNLGVRVQFKCTIIP